MNSPLNMSEAPFDPFAPMGRTSGLTISAIAGLIMAFIVWAALASVERLVFAEGRVIPSGDVQIIQNLEGGIVSEILVEPGQEVVAGQPLLRLNSAPAAAALGESRERRDKLLADVIRLQAEAQGTMLSLPAEFVTRRPDLAAQARNLFQARQDQLNQSRSAILQQIDQRGRELEQLDNRLDAIEANLKLLAEEISVSEPLVTKGAVSEVEIMRLKREFNSARDLQSTVEAQRAATRAQLSQDRQRLDELLNQYRAEVLATLGDVQADLAALEEGARAIEDRVQRTEVRSPVRGVIKQVLVNTIGGVIQPGADLLELVPLDAGVIVEARVKPEDVAFLVLGQRAVVQLTAYDFSVYGGVEGRLEHISADTIEDGEGNRFFIAKIRTETLYLDHEGSKLAILPGMIGRVNLIAGERTILAYLVNPIARIRDQAFREN